MVKTYLLLCLVALSLLSQVSGRESFQQGDLGPADDGAPNDGPDESPAQQVNDVDDDEDSLDGSPEDEDALLAEEESNDDDDESLVQFGAVKALASKAVSAVKSVVSKVTGGLFGGGGSLSGKAQEAATPSKPASGVDPTGVACGEKACYKRGTCMMDKQVMIVKQTGVREHPWRCKCNPGYIGQQCETKLDGYLSHFLTHGRTPMPPCCEVCYNQLTPADKYQDVPMYKSPFPLGDDSCRPSVAAGSYLDPKGFPCTPKKAGAQGAAAGAATSVAGAAGAALGMLGFLELGEEVDPMSVPIPADGHNWYETVRRLARFAAASPTGAAAKGGAGAENPLFPDMPVQPCCIMCSENVVKDKYKKPKPKPSIAKQLAVMKTEGIKHIYDPEKERERNMLKETETADIKKHRSSDGGGCCAVCPYPLPKIAPIDLSEEPAAGAAGAAGGAAAGGTKKGGIMGAIGGLFGFLEVETSVQAKGLFGGAPAPAQDTTDGSKTVKCCDICPSSFWLNLGNDYNPFQDPPPAPKAPAPFAETAVGASAGATGGAAGGALGGAAGGALGGAAGGALGGAAAGALGGLFG